MQSETAYFSPGAAIWWTQQKIRVVFDSDPLAPSCEKWRHPQNRKYNVLNCRKKRTEWWPRDNRYIKFGEIRTAVFDTCERTDKQTNKQTRLSQYFASLPRAKYRAVRVLRRSQYSRAEVHYSEWWVRRQRADKRGRYREPDAVHHRQPQAPAAAALLDAGCWLMFIPDGSRSRLNESSHFDRSTAESLGDPACRRRRRRWRHSTTAHL